MGIGDSFDIYMTFTMLQHELLLSTTKLNYAGVIVNKRIQNSTGSILKLNIISNF